MSRFTYDFGATEAQEFFLGFGELQELQELCDAGPQTILRRLVSGDWFVNDVSETIRLGLIGAGVAPLEALKIVKRYVKDADRGQMENVMIAIAVLSHWLHGPDGEEQPEKS